MDDLVILLILKVLLVFIGGMILINLVSYFLLRPKNLDEDELEEYQLTGQSPESEIAPEPELPTVVIASRSKEIVGNYLDKPIHAWVETEAGKRYTFESVAVQTAHLTFLVDKPGNDYLYVDQRFVYRLSNSNG